MKTSASKLTALGLSVVLALGGASGVVYASANSHMEPAAP